MEHNFQVQKLCVERYLIKMRFIADDFSFIASRISEIEAHLTLLGVSFDKVGSMPTTSDGDKLGSGLIDLFEARERLLEKNSLYRAEYEQACNLCEPHNRPLWALWLHYVQGKDWNVVAKILNYSERNIHYLANEGIQKLYPLMPEDYRRYTIPNALPL